jgi:hypothetical protein
MIDHRNRTAAGRRHTTSRPRRLLAVAAACLAMSACQSSAEPRSPDRRVSSAPASAAVGSPAGPGTTAVPQPARTFKATQQPCNIVDQRRVVSVLGPDMGNLTPPRTDTRSTVTVMTCIRTYGAPVGGRTIYSLCLQLANPTGIKAQYEGLRRVTARQTTLTDVTGLGQGAYTYTDPQIGENLVAYDGNLYLTLVVNPVIGAAKPIPDVVPMMIESVRVAMARLSQ